MDTQHAGGLPNIVIVGKGPGSKYLWNIFLKAYNHDEIILQYHDKNIGTAKTLIDGMKNFGWTISKNTTRRQMSTLDKQTGQEYIILINEIVLEKIRAIRGI